MTNLRSRASDRSGLALRNPMVGAAAFVALVGLWGCSSGGGGTGAGGSGGSGGATSAAGAGGGAALAGPCDLAVRVGGFAIQLNEAHTSISGGVRDAVRGPDVWQQEGAAEGGCRLMVGPSFTCTPTCAQYCNGPNQCVAEPRFQSAGDVTVSGVGSSPIVAQPLGNQYAPVLPSGLAFPPFAPGAAVSLAAAGATIPGFSLAGQGIEPLTFAGTGLKVQGGKAFSFSWTAPAQAGAATIFARLEIGHHGGVAARVECVLPDTGSGQIPAALVSALVAKGIHGFPAFSLTRETVDSTTIATGCVDLTVASPVERTVVACTSSDDATCIVSCNCGGVQTACAGDSTDVPCPSSKTCRMDYTCS
jgi:hypothetical protein